LSKQKYSISTLPTLPFFKKKKVRKEKKRQRFIRPRFV